ncbi:hypothetical protein ACFVT9_29355 [Kitasatospora cineracea]|uniref:hypothetical protein n=1 Tax=Kitasatospora cineracea TaxID=88074 RepID=UPI0036D99C72
MTDTTQTAETTESGHPEAETIRYTADVVAMRPDGSVLLIERGKPPYAGLLALTGVRAGSRECQAARHPISAGRRLAGLDERASRILGCSPEFQE